MIIQARLYMDTICSHSWNVRPAIERLRREYGETLDFDYVCYPLIGPDPSGWLDRRRRRFLSVHWAEVSEYGGEPIAHSLWTENAPNGSSLAGEAYLAARRQGIPLAHRYLERLQLSAMAQRGRISDPELLLVLAEDVGLDTAGFMADLESVRQSGEIAAVIDRARAKGIRSRPTLVLADACGREYWVIGPQTYGEFSRGVETLMRRPRARAGSVGCSEEPEVLAKIGGRILGFTDLRLRSAHRSGSGFNFKVGFGPGRPGDIKKDGAMAVRFLRVVAPRSGGYPWHLLAGIFTRFWKLGLSLTTVFGRRAGLRSETVAMIGVRIVKDEAGSLTAAGDAAEQAAESVRRELEAAGLETEAPSADDIEWLAELPDRSGRPVILQFCPGRPRSLDPVLSLPGGFALVTVLEPIPRGEMAAKQSSLQAAARKYRHWLTQDSYLPQAAALAESVRMREDHARRWNPDRGMWRTFAFFLDEGASEPEGADSGETLADRLEAVYRDPGKVSPVTADPLHIDTLAHITDHIRSFSLCAERWLHGADWWNTPLTAEEVSSYFPVK